MLSVTKEHLLERADTPEEKAQVEKYVTVHGQELSPTNYAVCQADLLIKNDRQATVHLGNSLIPHDPHSKEPGDQWPEPKWRFNRMLSNPPFGVTWGGKDGYEKEARKLEKTRCRRAMPLEAPSFTCFGLVRKSTGSSCITPPSIPSTAPTRRRTWSELLAKSVCPPAS
jgi:type I restriction enzyme M protein